MKRTGIKVISRAGVATVLPFFALLISEMGAMACERPTVVQSPHNGDSAFLYKAEKHWQVNIGIMKIMKVNNRRVFCLYIFYIVPGRGINR